MTVVLSNTLLFVWASWPSKEQKLAQPMAWDRGGVISLASQWQTRTAFWESLFLLFCESRIYTLYSELWSITEHFRCLPVCTGLERHETIALRDLQLIYYEIEEQNFNLALGFYRTLAVIFSLWWDVMDFLCFATCRMTFDWFLRC